jgi:glycosyltransferase involved in cell wall biosynthesis
MKIVQGIGWYLPETLGGTEIYVAALAARLAAAGHTVAVAAPEAVADGAGTPREYVHQGIPVFRYPVPSAPTRAEAQSLLPARGSDHLHAWLAAQRPDIAHFHTFVTGLGIHEMRAARAAGARVVVTSHAASLGYLCQRGSLMRWGTTPCDGLVRRGRCAACVLQNHGLPRPAAHLVATLGAALGPLAAGTPGRLGTALGMNAFIGRNLALQRELVATADRFVVLTTWALEAIAANGLPRQRLAVNRLGANSAVHQSAANSGVHQIAANGAAQRNVAATGGAGGAGGGGDTRAGRVLRLGYLGRFDPIKGVYDLVAAVSGLPAELPLTLELRGPLATDDERRVAAELADLAGGDPRITVGPGVPPDAVAALLAGWDLLCCPSLSYEGGPTVAIEAHAAGTPVLASRIGGVADLVTDGVNGRLLPPGDRPALAAALREVAENPAGTVDRWRLTLPPVRSMNEVADEYLALYRELLAP